MHASRNSRGAASFIVC